MPINAITVDLWDTIILDGSDEPKRSSKGLRSKYEERRHLFWRSLNRQSSIDKSITNAAFNVHEAAFRKTWYDLAVTWEVSDRLDILLKGLGRKLPSAELEKLIERFETMELTVKPDLIPRAKGVIEELARRYKLCVISDTIYTPGRNLRLLLDHHEVAQYFKGFVFSDEIKRSKPHADCFREAARQLNTNFAEMVHIGDRVEKDIVGAHQMGMKAILFTGVRDEGAEKSSKAEAIVDNYAKLIRTIDSL